jgi:hypothetical protein
MIEMTEQNACGQCGSEFPENAKFCPGCGAVLSGSEKSSHYLNSDELSGNFLKSASWKYIQLLIGILILVIAGTYFLSPTKEVDSTSGYKTITSTNKDYESGARPCENAGEATANGQYVCLGGYWVEQQVSDAPVAPQGRWITNCINVKVPNPNYDARKGFSAFVNEPYLNQEQCNQAYVYE